jgi:hypothetical protein
MRAAELLSGRQSGIAFGVRRACGIFGAGGMLQIAGWSSANAVASQDTGATSTPSS